jgi:hypothetical protein
MYPHERSLVKHLSGKPFVLIGVNSDSDISIPQKLAKSGKVTWRSFQDDNNGKKISAEWVVQGWPTVVLIDKDGVIQYRDHGSGLDEALKKVLEDAGESFPEEEIHATTKVESDRNFDQAEEAEEETGE